MCWFTSLTLHNADAVHVNSPYGISECTQCGYIAPRIYVQRSPDLSKIIVTSYDEAVKRCTSTGQFRISLIISPQQKRTSIEMAASRSNIDVTKLRSPADIVTLILDLEPKPGPSKYRARSDEYARFLSVVQRTMQTIRDSVTNERAAMISTDTTNKLNLQDRLLEAMAMLNQDISEIQTEMRHWQNCARQAQGRMEEYWTALCQSNDAVEPQQHGSDNKSDDSVDQGRVELEERNKEVEDENYRLTTDIATLEARCNALEVEKKTLQERINELEKCSDEDDEDTLAPVGKTDIKGKSITLPSSATELAIQPSGAALPGKPESVAILTVDGLKQLGDLHLHMWSLVREYFENVTVIYRKEDKEAVFQRMLEQFEAVRSLATKLPPLVGDDGVTPWPPVLEGPQSLVRKKVDDQWQDVEEIIHEKMRDKTAEELLEMLQTANAEAKVLRDRGQKVSSVWVNLLPLRQGLTSVPHP
jgi:FtsZ-binding cell division protein ZapB